MLKQKLQYRMKNKVFLGLGSNKGNKINFLIAAQNCINKNPNCSVLECSSIYETIPFGVEEQANFMNAAIEVETSFTLSELHKFTKQTEIEIGREKSFRWGPREIDIDILLFNNLVFESENLSVPHHDLMNRDFALKPLHQIKGDFVFPGTNKIINIKYLSELKNHIISVKSIELLN